MRWRRAAIGVISAGLAVSGLAACGGKTDEAARAAGITPADALAFFSVSLDPSVEQKRNLLGIARRFPDADVPEEFGEARDELLSGILEEVGLDYEEDVEPWLGSELAVAALPGGGGAGTVPRVAVLIEQDDEDRARAALEKVEAPLEYRFVDQFVVVAGGEPAEAAVTLDAFVTEAEDEGGDLAATKEFADVVDQLHGDRLLLGWVDGREAFETFANFFAAGALPARLPVDQLVPVAFDFHAGGDSLVLEAVARSTVEGNAGEPVLTGSLPQGLIGALTLFDIGAGIEQALQAAVESGADPLAEVEAQLGLDIETDILSWMGGEVTVAASPGEGGRPFPALALVVRPTDRGRAEAALPKIAAAIERGTGAPVEQRQIAGATAYVTPPARDGMQPAMALFEDRFVLASTPAYLEALATGASENLAESDAYRSVVGEESSDATRFQVFLDLDSLRETLERLLLGDDPAQQAEYEQDVLPNVEPFDAFGVVMRRDGDYERVEVKLTFD